MAQFKERAKVDGLSMTIEKAEEKDFGKYSCVALKNGEKQSEGEIDVTCKPSF